MQEYQNGKGLNSQPCGSKQEIKTSGNIHNKFLKSSVSVICPFVTNLINYSIENSSFPDKLKLAEITPAPKTDDSKDVSDFRPNSILLLYPSFLRKLFQTS